MKFKVTPEYNVRPAGNKHRQRFLCELRCPGFYYVAAENSTSKKDAQANAARDFVSYLVRQGKMNSDEVPKESGVPEINAMPAGGGSSGGLGLTRQQPMFDDGFSPRSLGAAYHRQDQTPGEGDFRRDFLDKMNKKNMEESEEVDVNAGIHGNWTMDNAKGMLHQFLQINKINADYRYSKQGMSFVAEMSIFVKVNTIFLKFKSYLLHS